MKMMTINNVCKNYYTHTALSGVNMNIEQGKIVGLLGPNGSGKTTLMKIIAGISQPDAGDITYPNGAARGLESKKTISFLPDKSKFPSWMTTKDIFDYHKDMYPDFDEDRADHMIKLLGIDNMTGKLKKMSKGMQERVSLALVFSRQTDLYLLDEPLGGIDPVGKMKVLESIVTLDLDKSTVLLSTHLVKDVETIFDKVFFLANGKIVYENDCERIREEEGKTVEQAYLEVFLNV